MNARHLALLGAACALALGCRNDPYVATHIELQNAARRAVEDQFYELQFEYEKKAKEAEQLRKENEQLRKGGAKPAGASTLERSAPPDIQAPTIEMPSVTPSEEPEQPQTPDEDFGPLRPPVVEPGVPSDPPPITPSKQNGQLPPTPPAKATGDVPQLDLADPRVAQVEIDSQMTQADDWDGKIGDDGLRLVIQPQNQQGKYLPLAGPVSVVLLDPSATGEQKRVARWDLDSTDVDQQMRSADSRDGIQLKLPWPGEKRPQAQSQLLQLCVRYVTADGRKLDSSSSLSLNTTRSANDKWTARATTSPTPPPPTPNKPASTPPINIARPEWSPYR